MSRRLVLNRNLNIVKIAKKMTVSALRTDLHTCQVGKKKLDGQVLNLISCRHAWVCPLVDWPRGVLGCAQMVRWGGMGINRGRGSLLWDRGLRLGV